MTRSEGATAPPDLVDLYCLMAGRLTIAWAALEREIDELIWELAGTKPEKGACLTSQMIGPGPRMKALMSLLSEWKAPKTITAKFRVFGTAVGKLGAKRNRYAHDTVHPSLVNGLMKQEITADRILRFRSDRLISALLTPCRVKSGQITKRSFSFGGN